MVYTTVMPVVRGKLHVLTGDGCVFRLVSFGGGGGGLNQYKPCSGNYLEASALGHNCSLFWGRQVTHFQIFECVCLCKYAYAMHAYACLNTLLDILILVHQALKLGLSILKSPSPHPATALETYLKWKPPNCCLKS